MDMMQWCARWRLPPQAIEELRAVLGAATVTASQYPEGMSETAVQQRLRIHGSNRGLRLWRNNRGALKDTRGIPVRYGLANESEAMDKMIKSSDLVGIQPITITPAHVGKTIGRFVSVEAKRAGWQYAGGEREEAQLRWINLICSYGGAGGFAQSEADIDSILTR